MTLKSKFSALGFLLLLGLLSPDRAAGELVLTSNGYLEGAPSKGTIAYLGIPFAAPPVGALRWKPPAPVAPWRGVRKAFRLPAECPQRVGLGASGELTGSEDCLYLNVWVPQGTRPTDRIPVLVFVHGGGLSIGSSVTPLYDGANLARRGEAIVVTVQYRLGVLGYLAHPALSAETAYGGSGNYGLMDQVASLQWVQQNIGAFGGDRANVTLFGESGGAASVCSLLATPLTRGLFSKAIMESMSCPAISKSSAETEGMVSALAAGCPGTGASTAQCLRNRSAAALVQGSVFTMISRVDYRRSTAQLSVDGYSLPDLPLDRLRTGKGQPVPLLIGNNAEEGHLFIPYYYSTSSLAANVERHYGPAIRRQIYALYPSNDVVGNFSQAVALFGDHLFACPIRRAARAKVAGGSAPVYRYLFDYRPTIGGIQTPPIHGSELPFVFQNFDQMKGGPLSPSDIEMERLFLRYWIQFARTGNPNDASLPLWDPFVPADDNYLVLNPAPRPGSGYRKAQCDLFDVITKGKEAGEP